MEEKEKSKETKPFFGVRGLDLAIAFPNWPGHEMKSPS